MRATSSPLNTPVIILSRRSRDDSRQWWHSGPSVFEITLHCCLVPESSGAEFHYGKRKAAVRSHLEHSLSRSAGIEKSATTVFHPLRSVSSKVWRKSTAQVPNSP